MRWRSLYSQNETYARRRHTIDRPLTIEPLSKFFYKLLNVAEEFVHVSVLWLSDLQNDINNEARTAILQKLPFRRHFRSFNSDGDTYMYTMKLNVQFHHFYLQSEIYLGHSLPLCMVNVYMKTCPNHGQ